MRSQNGRYSPVIICDVCEQRIALAERAVVVFPIEPPNNDPGDNDPGLAPGTQRGEIRLDDVLHTHRDRCLDQAVRQLGGPAKATYDRLDSHLLRLIENVRLTPQRLGEMQRAEDDPGSRPS